MDASETLIRLCEEGMMTWEELARECIAQMSIGDAESVADALDIEYED